MLFGRKIKAECICLKSFSKRTLEATLKFYLNLYSLFALTIFLFIGRLAVAEKCHFSPDPDSLKIHWTAFKTTEKIAVNGEFGEFKFAQGAGKFSSLTKMIESFKVSVDLSSVKTGDNARDFTLKEFFFKKLTGGSAEGTVLNLKENDKTAELELTFNKFKKKIPLKIEILENEVIAKGDFDLLAFKANTAFDSLHAQCNDLHKGKDGVSKTWSTVELTLKGKFSKQCL